MATTPLGWPVLDPDVGTGPYPRLRRFMIPGVNRALTLRDGSAGFVLVHFALWFDEDVERLDLGIWDEWGYARRPVTNGTRWSEHAGGTAMDLNATRHPYDVPTRKTFTVSQINRIHRRLDWMDDVLRWGGDYRSKQDAMHFEVQADLAKCERVAKRLINTPRGRRVLTVNPGLKKVIYS